jgi:hypothetical protein
MRNKDNRLLKLIIINLLNVCHNFYKCKNMYFLVMIVFQKGNEL